LRELLGCFVSRELMEAAFNTDKKTVRAPHFSNLYSNYVNVFSHEGVYRFEPKPQVTRLPGVRIAGTFSNTL
jgi:hypothetical protein